MERAIILSRKEERRIRVMEQVVFGSMSLAQGCHLLGVSYRQGKRIRKRYMSDGAAGLAHKGRGKPSAKALSIGQREAVLSLKSGVYAIHNDTHFTEALAEREDINLSRETVRQILRGAGVAAKRGRKAPQHRKRRERRPVEGMMAQWDGSPHRWFGDDLPPCCLMAAVDDATGKLLGALFAQSESSESYLRLLAMMVQRHGVPVSVYHDRHGSLVRNDPYWSIEEELAGSRYPTHVGRVLAELGIGPIQAGSPQAKGRIERAFGVLQDRMIAEMRLDGIKDIKTANEWLKKIFIARHNARFAKPAPQEGSAFRKVGAQEMYNAMAFAYEAAVGSDNCVRIGGLMIDIPADKGGRGYAKSRVMARQHLDGKWSVWKDGEKIATHKATAFREPLRQWKRRNGKLEIKGRETIQVYIASKPASRKRGHFHLADRGTF
jgi:transposase